MENLTEKEYKIISTFAKNKIGVTFSPEKKALIYARLRNRIVELNIKSFAEYIDYIEKDKSGEELVFFTNKMTTNHTYFMRESEHFYYLLEQILPIVKKNTASYDLRLWCAGCSSGEEAYMLAMFVDQYFKTNKNIDTTILATDISTVVLTKAINGVYPNESLDVLEKKFIRSYFDKYDNENVIVKKSLRDKVIFRSLNLIYDQFKFKKPLQVIFCRNVMIYFDNETKTKLVKKFYDALEPGGFFVISHSESLSNLQTDFVVTVPGIYIKPLV